MIPIIWRHPLPVAQPSRSTSFLKCFDFKTRWQEPTNVFLNRWIRESATAKQEGFCGRTPFPFLPMQLVPRKSSRRKSLSYRFPPTAHAAGGNLQLVPWYAFFFRSFSLPYKISLFSPTSLLSAERSGGAYTILVPLSPTFRPVLLNNAH